MITLPWLLPLMGWFKTNPRNVWLIAGLLAALAVSVGLYMKGRGDEAKAEAAREAIAVERAKKSDVRANQKAGAQLARDALARAEKEKRLEDEVLKVADGAPGPVGVRAACLELCEQGTSVADLPECRVAPGGPPACRPR